MPAGSNSLAAAILPAPRDPYVNGYVYPSGPLALGSARNAPIIEVRNSLSSPVTLVYEGNSPQRAGALCSRQAVSGRGFCLIAGLLPSNGDFVSTIHVEDTLGNAESFAFEHDPTNGYTVRPIDAVNGAGKRYVASLDLRSAGEPFALTMSGCCTPRWAGNIVVPLRVAGAPQAVPEPSCAAE